MSLINDAQLAKLSLMKRLIIAVIKDVSLPLALSLSDGRLSIREAKEISTVILEAVSRELLQDKLLLVEKNSRPVTAINGEKEITE